MQYFKASEPADLSAAIENAPEIMDLSGNTVQQCDIVKTCDDDPFVAVQCDIVKTCDDSTFVAQCDDLIEVAAQCDNTPRTLT